MRIKKNTKTQIVAELLGVKASRLAADAAMQQATRELLADEQVRPTARKPKKGVQGVMGRVRVERVREAVVPAKRILELEDMLAEMAIAEVLKDERGHWYQSPQHIGLRWTHPAKFACGVGAHHAACWYDLTIEGLMAFESELYYNGILPRGYVTPDEIVVVTGRQLGK